MLNYLLCLTKSQNQFKPFRRFNSKLCNFTFIFLFFIFTFSYLHSQSWVSEVSESGFIIKKVVSDTLVPTGQPFSYTIYYTIPAGATNVSITDQLPPNLIFLNHSVNNACGTPTVTTPPPNSQGGTVGIAWQSVPNGCSGSITITVKFENGITCNGVSVRNRACLNAVYNDKDYSLCTGFLSTTAQASNPWHINKYPVGLAWIGGNCPWATANDTVTYQICVYKNVGTTGQLNLVNGVVTDTLPSGAILVGSTCNATQTGNIVTWNVGNMSANQQYNSVCCQIKIYYPPNTFPNNTIISNTAVLSGTLGSANQPCGTFTESAQTCVKKVVIQSATISKWVYTNRQPGCSGQYLIYICNTGTTTMQFTALDTLPSSLSNFTLGTIWPGSINATIGNNNILTIQGSLQAGQCAYVYVNFTIPSNATVGTQIQNCVWLQLPTAQQHACATFTVEAPAANPCLWKEICNAQSSYTPGSTFRYRLRIQNIGGLPLSGVTLTDVLDPNLEYIGNPSYYIANTWNIPNCNPNPTPNQQWTGVSINYNSNTNTVTATLPTIQATCQNLFYTNCGMYGTSNVPYYYIEFDVKVRDTAALGNIPNKFTLSGGALGNQTFTSNTVFVLVSGNVGFNLKKEVRKESEQNFSNNIYASAGSNVVYKLQMNSTGTASLAHVTFVDLLPLDNAPADSKILQNCNPRGSQYNITYNNLVGTPIPSTILPYNNPSTTLANVNNLNPVGAPGNVFTIGCGTGGTWTSGITAGNKNIAAYYGSTAVGSTGAEVQFSAKIDANATPEQVSCNTFAASGWTKHLIQSSILNYQLAGQLESNPVCVKIDTLSQQPSDCIKDLSLGIKCIGIDPTNGFKQYSVAISGSSCAPAVLLISSPNGTFSPATFNITSSSWNVNTTFLNTTNSTVLTIYYTLSCKGIICRDSIRWNLPPCPTEPTDIECCREFIRKISNEKITYNSATGYVGLTALIQAGPIPIQRFSATIVSAQLKRVCLTSFPSWSRVFGDITGGGLFVAPAPGPQLLNIYSREAVWGYGECIDWNKLAQLKLDMLFPPLSGGKGCYDTLLIGIRYSFTNCQCVTCDTVKYYTIVRKAQFIPWVTKINKLVLQSASQNNETIQQNEPEETSLVMDNATNGTLWVVSPDVPENQVIIKGIELTSENPSITEISSNGNLGIIEGHTAFIETNIIPGNKVPIKIKLSPHNLNVISIEARFLYKFKDDEELFYSEPVLFVARIPGIKADEIGIDTDAKPNGVKTYALYIHNSNGYKQSIYGVAAKIENKAEILAVGPPLTINEEFFILPGFDDEGSFYIGLPSGDRTILKDGQIAKTVYLTIAYPSEDNPVLNFRTLDENGHEISKGSLILTNPVSSVTDEMLDPEKEVFLNIYPNPAQGNLSVSLSTPKTLQNVRITIRDIAGKEVDLLTMNAVLQSGAHLFNYDTSKLTNGAYILEVRAINTSISQTFIIQK